MKQFISECNRIKQFWTICLVLFLNFGSNNAQIVSTFLTGSGLNGPDGFALDSSENLYCANWGGGAGNTVLKITSSASVTVFNSTLNAPDGLAFDSVGNIFVSNYASGIISKITPEGVKTEFASGFNHPSALAFDREWNLYISNHTGNTVSKITHDSTVTTFASGFNKPLGLVFDPEGNLYVSNYNSGIVNKVTTDGTVTVFATVPNPAGSMIQYLVRGPSGNLYLPSYGHHQIYKISPAGEVSVFAGTGVAGSTDGPVATAQFNGPNSIALTGEGDIYVSEYNANRIRKITGVEPISRIEGRLEINLKEYFLLQNYPNPFNPETKISYQIPEWSFVTLKVYDVLSNEITSLVNEEKPAGKYAVNYDASNLPSGIYFYKISSGSFSDVKKMLLIK